MTRPPPIRLVVLLEDLEFGGTQRYALQLLQGIDRSWFSPELWVLRAGDDLLAAVEATGVPVTYLSRGQGVGPRALWRLLTQLRRHRPAVLYTLTVLPNIWGRLFAGLLRIPIVSGYRSLRPRQHERLLQRFSARVVTNAALLKRHLVGEIGLSPDQVSVIANGVDTDDFSPHATARSPAPLVVCVARLVGEKDIPTLLAAFALVRAAVPDAQVDIIGNGPLAMSPPPGVRFLAAANDVQVHLRRAWVFTLSSRSEASPNVILEAMACGLPVVATSVGGIPELVDSGKTGELVPAGDPTAMAAALVSLLRDEARREALGEAGRQRVIQKFGLPRMVTQTEAVLRQVAQRGARWTATEAGDIPPELPLPPSTDAVSARNGETLIERGRFRPDRSLQNVTAATLTVHLPAPGSASGAAVVICPGGGYAALSIDKEGHDVARWFAARGVAGLVLKYRLPDGAMPESGPPWPIEDVAAALRLARQHATAWGIDARRIGVMGFSAGGHMAAAASAMDRELAFAVLVYPVVSMASDLAHAGSRLRLLGKHPDQALVERYSFDRHVTARTPPTFLVHARDDKVAKVGNTLAYADGLQRAGVLHEALLFEQGGHGFGLGLGLATPPWPQQCLAWLAAQSIVRGYDDRS